MELLALAPGARTTVLDLCGLWGGRRQAKNFVPRVITSKEILRGKVRYHFWCGLVFVFAGPFCVCPWEHRNPVVCAQTSVWEDSDSFSPHTGKHPYDARPRCFARNPGRA